jgi:hypothetical protein
MRNSRLKIPLLPGFPIRVRSDLLYRWSTLRIRRRPVKMFAMILTLGAFCWFAQWVGIHYLEPRIRGQMIPVTGGYVQGLLLRSLGALFSSLNILSCSSIVIMGGTLRHLAGAGHMEALMLAPGRFRPSALYYGLAMRYMPLTLIVLLINFADARTSPFTSPPFEFANEPVPITPLPLLWAGLHQAAIIVFCPANLFMDLAIAYWLMIRFRPSYLVTAFAVLIVGFVSPLVLVSIYDTIDEEIFRRARMGAGPLAEWVRGPVVWPSGQLQANAGPFIYALRDMQSFFHYSITAAGSVALGLLALANLDSVWRKQQDSTHKDPVLIRSG